MIRAHGVSPARRRELQQLHALLADATCPDVAKIQGLIRREAAKGYHIVIFGDEGHAEVLGLLGFAEGRGHVVSTAEDVARLPDMHPVCLVSQSTQLPAAYEEVGRRVRERFADALILDTICDSTRNRQQELAALAKEVDAIVVVGGVHSANTVRLVELARSLKPTHHIETAAELQRGWFDGCSAVGVTAGASTPAFVIEDVRAALEAM
jgi:(E)-4-hydroxy-3-methyl-but-2-enyl pyrophosphate reductase